MIKHLTVSLLSLDEYALTAAKKADESRAQGKAGLLTGIPSHKKIFFAQKALKPAAAQKCWIILLHLTMQPWSKSLNAAGTVMLGKTNMDEFAMGSSNENSYYGPVKNPWDLDYVPGGSSGGSAAAVAARLVPGRNRHRYWRLNSPTCCAHAISPVIKPTYGRVSRYGMIAFASSLDQGGPMAKTAEDTAILLNAMAGFDEHDSTSVDEPVPDYTATLK